MLLQFNPEGSHLAFLHTVANCSCSKALGAAEQQLTAQQLWVADLTASQNLWQVPLPLARKASFNFGRHGQLLVCGTNGIWEASVEQKIAQQLHLPAAGASGVSAGLSEHDAGVAAMKTLKCCETLSGPAVAMYVEAISSCLIILCTATAHHNWLAWGYGSLHLPSSHNVHHSRDAGSGTTALAAVASFTPPGWV